MEYAGRARVPESPLTFNAYFMLRRWI